MSTKQLDLFKDYLPRKKQLTYKLLPSEFFPQKITIKCLISPAYGFQVQPGDMVAVDHAASSDSVYVVVPCKMDMIPIGVVENIHHEYIGNETIHTATVIISGFTSGFVNYQIGQSVTYTTQSNTADPTND